MNRRTHRSLAFTLIELLLVISIFVLLLAIAAPAFSSMLYSSEQSMAENSLRTGIAAARDAAIRSAQGEDAAAVFFYDYRTGRSSILPCIRAGTLKDQDPNGGTTYEEREVFVPVPGFEPVQLPRGWSARGYAPAGMLDDPTAVTYGHSWYVTSYVSASGNHGNWVFPETSFYDEDEPNNDDFGYRNTFMVRFEGGTGILKQDGTPVLVLAVNPSMQARGQTPWNLYQSGGQYPFRPDLEADGARFVRRVTAWPAVGGQPLNMQRRSQLLGTNSGDSVMAKPVTQVALCSEKKLAAALGVRLDPVTNSIYQDPAMVSPPAPLFVDVNGAPWNDQRTVNLNAWIEDHLYPSGNLPALPDDTRVPSDCRIFSIQRYLGTLQDISGTIAGQGVSS